jgi:endonuclease YncB( thermonuclease family)|tara:strand:+ start:417 stop:776 length:360 start_codon:yes stop_codon:yes gene_type:complete
MTPTYKFRNLIKTILLLSSLIPSLSLADTIIGEVIFVADGDTITVISEGIKYKIRLSGINAPEKKQTYGVHSKQSLVDMVSKQTVSVSYNKRDRYKRIIGKVILDGQDINLEQIRRGLA